MLQGHCTTRKDSEIEDLIAQGAECSGHEPACEQLHRERSINQQPVHDETLSWQQEAGQGASALQDSAPGATNQGMVIKGTGHVQRQKVRRRTSKPGVTDAHAVLVSARRAGVSTPWGSALYSQPCMSRRAKTPSRNFSSSLLPTNTKHNDGLYWFWAAVSVPVGYLACVSYQSASVRMKVLTLTWCCCKSSPRELWIRKPSRL